MNYEDSINLLKEYIKNPALQKHCFAVESCMRFYAKSLGEDEERWGLAGLLHDLDWEMFPDTHPVTAVPILEKAGYDKEFIDTILSHAYPDRTDIQRDTPIKKYLFACDEITGFVNAYSLMKQGGLNDVEPRSIIKKMKDKAFARNVNRYDIKKGAEEINLDLTVHIQNIINTMKEDSRL